MNHTIQNETLAVFCAMHEHVCAQITHIDWQRTETMQIRLCRHLWFKFRWVLFVALD